MSKAAIYSRSMEQNLLYALEDSPVVLIHGPRQCGKTTLAQLLGEKKGYSYFSFDNDVIYKAALDDPVGFVADLPERTILDEVQRVPGLFTSIKATVDRNRTPGRFILTGSANVLLVPALSDSLAGRMEILRLHPLAQAEISGQHTGFLDTLLSGKFSIDSHERLGKDLSPLIVAGGYPAALARSRPTRAAAWYRDYIETLLQRDVRDMAHIQSTTSLQRLLSLIAGQTSRLLNVSDLSAPFQLSRPTIRDYISLLSRLFLVEELQPWHNNRLKRLIKTPKLHFGDTGVACALLGITSKTLEADRSLLGQFLETFVYQELRRQASWRDEALSFYHFRDKDGVEVDIVLEAPELKVAGVEVKASSTVTSSDFCGLRKLRNATGERFTAGVVVYDGENTLPFGDKLYAVPIRSLW